MLFTIFIFVGSWYPMMLLLFWHLTSLPLFLYAAFGLDISGPGDKALLPLNLWYTQIPIAVALILLAAKVCARLSRDKTGVELF